MAKGNLRVRKKDFSMTANGILFFLYIQNVDFMLIFRSKDEINGYGEFCE